jgi:hypothetical protein
MLQKALWNSTPSMQMHIENCISSVYRCSVSEQLRQNRLSESDTLTGNLANSVRAMFVHPAAPSGGYLLIGDDTLLDICLLATAPRDKLW